MSNENTPLRMTPAALQALLKGDRTNALRAMIPGGIEAQEAEGQQAFVSSQTLPRKCLECTREDLEHMGIVFGAPVDDLFVEATLPPGWTIVPRPHGMWSELRDMKGRVRADIFYKAAFYDRRAHISVTHFFQIQQRCLDATGRPTEDYPPAFIQVVIINGNNVPSYESISVPYDQDALIREQEAACRGWLTEHYPLYQEYGAYWD